MRKTFRRRHFRKAITYFLVCCLAMNTTLAPLLALELGDRTSASGVIGTQWGDHAIIDTNHGAIINWNNFNTTGAQSVEFRQYLSGDLSNMSAVLNRVSGSATQFDGILNANGRVFIVNPAGVIFGAGSVINVSQLVASGLGMSNDAFNAVLADPANQMVFSGGAGNVINDGTINATDSVYLVGQNVTNNGSIFCPDGLVVMTAADSVMLGQPGSAVIVDLGDLDAGEENLLSNNGPVSASTLVLAAGDVFSQAISNVENLAVTAAGSIEIDGDVTVDEDIALYADDGEIDIFGDMTATAGDIAMYGYEGIYIEDEDGETIAAGGNIDLTSDNNINIYTNVIAGENIDMTAEDTVYIDGTLTATNGYIDVSAGYEVKLEGAVQAQGDVILTARGEDGAYVSADGTITSLGGNVDITAIDTDTDGADAEIDLDGEVEAYGDLSLFADTTDSSANVYAEGLTTLTGDIDIFSDYDITLDGPVEAYRHMTLSAGTDGDSVNAYGDVYANSTLTTITGDLTIDATYEIYFEDVVDAYGDITVTTEQPEYRDTYIWSDSDATITSQTGDVSISADYYIDLWGDVEAYGNLTLSADGDAAEAELYAESLTTVTGDIDVFSDYYLELYSPVEAGGSITLTAGNDGDDNWAYGEIYADSTLTALAGDITVNGSYNVEFNDAVEAYGDVTITTTQPYYVDAYVESYGSDATITSLNGDVSIAADYYIDLEGDVSAQNNISLIADGPEGLSDGSPPLDNDGYIEFYGALNAETGNINVVAEYSVDADPAVTAGGDVSITSQNSYIDMYESDITAGGNVALNAYDYIYLENSDVSADGDITMTSEDSYVEVYNGDVSAGQNITLAASTEVIIDGTITAETGDVEISADGDDTIYLNDDVTAGGSITLNDNAYAAGDLVADQDVTFNGNLTLDGGEWVYDTDIEAWVWQGDQLIQATNGTITAESWIMKETPGELRLYGGDPDLAIDLQYPGDLDEEDAAIATAGNLYMRGNGDIQIAGDVTALGGEYWGSELPEPPGEPWQYPMDIGGVSIISENGKIYTDGATPENDTLNVVIEGYSDDISHRLDEGEYDSPIGVDLPLDSDRKAAIVLISADDLKLGSASQLIAEGEYLASVEDMGEFFSRYGDFEELLDGLEGWENLIAAFEGDLEAFEIALSDSVDVEEIFQWEDAYLYFLDVVQYVFDNGAENVGVDDRAAIGFLDEAGQIIAGHLRDQGHPLDVAIYAASAEGDVAARTGAVVDVWVGDGVGIDAESSVYADMGGAMAIYAYDTITLDGGLDVSFSNLELIGDLEELDWIVEGLLEGLDLEFGIEVDTEIFGIQLEMYFEALGYESDEDYEGNPALLGDFESFLEDYFADETATFIGDGGVDWLELCSRITGTLNAAIAYGRLPGADDPDFAPDGVRRGATGYVLRGEGDLGVNSAWTLEIIAPLAMPDFGQTPKAVTLDDFDVLANDQGDALPITVQLESPTSDEGGALTVNPDGSVTYEPPTDLSGLVFDESGEAMDTFTYTVTDLAGIVSETATATITLTNQLPATVIDETTTDQGVAVIIDVLSNDVDADNEPLVITSFDYLGDGDVALNGDGTLTYTPEDGFSGVEAFIYSVTDGYNVSSEVVIVTVNAPVNTQSAPGLEPKELDTLGYQTWVQWLTSGLDIEDRMILARLYESGSLLGDPGGTYLAALAQLLNEFGSSATPPTEEQMASIANAIAGGGTQYALAGEYLDALANCITILTDEIGLSSAEAVAFVMENFVGQMGEGENAGVAAFVAASLAALGQ